MSIDLNRLAASDEKSGIQHIDSVITFNPICLNTYAKTLKFWNY